MAKTSEAMLRAIDNYNKTSTKTVTIRFMPGDMDLYEHLCRQPNKAGYIKDLISADMQEDTYFRCSNCGFPKNDDDFGISIMRVKPTFCPNCGAKVVDE